MLNSSTIASPSKCEIIDMYLHLLHVLVIFFEKTLCAQAECLKILNRKG